MNELMKMFDFNGSIVRTILKNGECWWVAQDVCAVLGIGLDNVSKTCKELDQDEKGITKTDTLGGKQNMIIVNEYGLMRKF